LRVSERGRDDPLEPADLELIGSLAREVGGTLSIQSPPKGGTLITARLPLNLGGPVDQADPR
jgi:hypothetical protein